MDENTTVIAIQVGSLAERVVALEQQLAIQSTAFDQLQSRVEALDADVQIILVRFSAFDQMTHEHRQAIVNLTDIAGSTSKALEEVTGIVRHLSRFMPPPVVGVKQDGG